MRSYGKFNYMECKIVTISGSETRHKFLPSYLSQQKNIKVLLSIQEKVIKLQDNNKFKKSKIFLNHLNDRKKIENKYFKKYVNKKKNFKTIKIKKGDLEKKNIIEKIKRLNPNFIIAFGCSILREDFLKEFENKILNIHLGLSPYYRGSGTNFFPFYFKELQFLGSTVMKIDKGIDTGKIVTQIRPNFKKDDNIHTLGNKIIFKSVETVKKILISRKKIKSHRLITEYRTRVLKNKDFTIEILKKAQKNLKNGLIENYLKKKKKLENKYKIIVQY